MTFVAGALAGLVVGIAAAMVLGRRTLPAAAPVPDARATVAVAVAAIALVVAAIAMARSGHHDRTIVSAPATTTTAIAAPATLATPASTTPPVTSLGGTVSVPNVVLHAQKDAVTALENAGLRVSIQTLSLSNVTAGFVISQNPLPAALVPRGTTVALVVSAPS